MVAVEPTKTFELDPPALTLLILRHPEIGAALLRVLGQRLRNTDDLMDQAMLG